LLKKRKEKKEEEEDEEVSFTIHNILDKNLNLNNIYLISQEIVQSAGTIPNKAEVTSLNHPSPSYVDMSKIIIIIIIIIIYSMNLVIERELL
jgi:hypothetical protein